MRLRFSLRAKGSLHDCTATQRLHKSVFLCFHHCFPPSPFPRPHLFCNLWFILTAILSPPLQPQRCSNFHIRITLSCRFGGIEGCHLATSPIRVMPGGGLSLYLFFFFPGVFGVQTLSYWVFIFRCSMGAVATDSKTQSQPNPIQVETKSTIKCIATETSDMFVMRATVCVTIMPNVRYAP